MKALVFAVGLLAAVGAQAGMINGDTFNLGVSATGGMTITGGGAGVVGGTTPGYCVGPNGDNCASSGLQGGAFWNPIDATHNELVVTTFGGTFSGGPGTFDLAVSGLNANGLTITAVSYTGGSLAAGAFALDSFNGDSITLRGSTSDLYIANGNHFTFNVTTTEEAATPEPGSIMLFGSGLLAIAAFVRSNRKA